MGAVSPVFTGPFRVSNRKIQCLGKSFTQPQLFNSEITMKHFLELCRATLPGPLALLACLSLGLGCAARADEIVYDNTASPIETYYPSMLEYGDEIQLGGTARTITEFQFEYLGDFLPEQDASVNVRLYKNDGVYTNAGDFFPPGTLLYESGPQRIFPGYNVLALKNLSVAASNSITWTVKFIGLGNTQSNRAGLTFYNPPTVGSSYDDFWVKTNNGWQLWVFGGNPPANFAARLIAAPDTAMQVLSTTPNPDATHTVVVQGPAYSGAVLEVATGQTNWETVNQFLFSGKPLTIEDITPRAETPEYRVRASTTPVLLLSAGRPDFAGRQTLRASGVPSHGFIVETARDLASWFPIYTNDLVSVNCDFKDPMSVNLSRRFYRAYYVRDLATAMGYVSYMTNYETLVKASGPPGRDCVIEWTKNFRDWTPLATNVFSFTTKTIAFVDPGTTNLTQRFYRIRVAP